MYIRYAISKTNISSGPGRYLQYVKKKMSTLGNERRGEENERTKIHIGTLQLLIIRTYYIICEEAKVKNSETNSFKSLGRYLHL